MFFIRYLTMHKVHMHAGAIRRVLYGCTYVREIIHSLKIVDYLPVHTHKPYNNLHLMFSVLSRQIRSFYMLSDNVSLIVAHFNVIYGECVEDVGGEDNTIRSSRHYHN